MSLTNDLHETIKQHLPAEVSATLQERLRLADRLEEDHSELTARVKDAESRAKSTEELERVDRELLARKEAIDERERELTFQERLDTILADNERARREDTWRMLELLLANRTVRQRVQEDIPLACPDSQSSFPSVFTHEPQTETRSSTTETEEA